jgi:hypothetical protein
MRTAERQAQGVLETAQTRLTLATRIGEAQPEPVAVPAETASEAPSAADQAPQGSRWPPVPPNPAAVSEPGTEPGAAPNPGSVPGQTDYTDPHQPPPTPSSTNLPANGVPAQAEPGIEETVRFRPEES